MTKFISILALFCLISFSQNLAAREWQKTIEIRGVERNYRVYRPDNLPADRPVPLVLVIQLREGFDDIADEKGFVVAVPYPDGNWNNDCERSTVDVEYFSQVIDECKREQNCREVFLTGFSGGAVIAHVMACRIPSKITAVAGVAGCLYNHPTGPVSVLEIHGTKDKNVPYVGMTNSYGKWLPGTRDMIHEYVEMSGLAEEPVVTYPVVPFPSFGLVTMETWGPGTNGKIVSLVTITNGTHVKPSSESPAMQSGYDVRHRVWDFFSQFIKTNDNSKR